LCKFGNSKTLLSILLSNSLHPNHQISISKFFSREKKKPNPKSSKAKIKKQANFQILKNQENPSPNLPQTLKTQKKPINPKHPITLIPLAKKNQSNQEKSQNTIKALTSFLYN
jgi:hypothetical protein